MTWRWTYLENGDAYRIESQHLCVRIAFMPDDVLAEDGIAPLFPKIAADRISMGLEAAEAFYEEFRAALLKMRTMRRRIDPGYKAGARAGRR